MSFPCCASSSSSSSSLPCNRRRGLLRVFSLLLVALFSVGVSNGQGLDDISNVIHLDGSERGVDCFEKGQDLFDERDYDGAAIEYWKAVLLNEKAEASGDGNEYDVTVAFQQFMQCYIIQGKPADGLAFVALESFRRGQLNMGKTYLEQALTVDPNNPLALQVKEEYADVMFFDDDEDNNDDDDDDDYFDDDDDDDEDDEDEDDGDEEKEDGDELFPGKTPEELYELGSVAFREKQYEECADLFELSCYRSKYTLSPSCSNAVYCRGTILDWGYNGTQHRQDMERIKKIVTRETRQYRRRTPKETTWQRASSCHPHMMLGYPLDDNPVLKRYVTESVAFMDEKMARVSIPDDSNKDKPQQKYTIQPLPDNMPFRHDTPERIESYNDEYYGDDFKLRVGFIGSGFNSKAVLYLSQDMFKFFDRSKYEIHVFSIGPEDSPYFIKHGMRDVDWRKRVIKYIGGNKYFHDVQSLAQNHIELAKLIHDKYNIHILIEWDGYARQGERAQGLFALRPAPIQIYHQEYLGTSGAVDYVDYLFTDVIASPPDLPRLPHVDNDDIIDDDDDNDDDDDDDSSSRITIDNLYTEKLIYLPNHFFSKGHALQEEVIEPTYDYQPLPSKKKHKQYKYQLGIGSPQENKCMQAHKYQKDVSVVFCNFNKFLKNNPETLSSWIRVLQQVPDSLLCLLENPTEGIPYLRKFVYEFVYETGGNGKEGDEINDRIMFLPWERNPFDHQRRNFDFCNINLDSYPYNGHTTAQDALYAGVPIVTRSDGYDMASRVTTSANIVLGLDGDLNAYGGIPHYEQIAVELGNKPTKLKRVRDKLIDTALQHTKNSSSSGSKKMHPYWDVQRYVKNFENGLSQAYENFLDGNPPKHIFVYEEEEEEQQTDDPYDATNKNDEL